MSDISETKLESYLARFSESDWSATIEEILPCVHQVDRNATQIWFRFFPLTLYRFIKQAKDPEEMIRSLSLQGNFELKDQIDTSHSFLYGHRYWKIVKAAIIAEAQVFTDQTPTLVEEIKQIGMLISEKLKVERPLLNGIVLIGLMTLNQVGLEAFKATDGDVEKPTGIMAKGPDQIVRARAQDDSQGIFGFLKTVNKKYSVAYTDAQATGKFNIINDEEIASASARDQSQSWKDRDERCWEGVVPVECRSASCGTCWVGVLGGQEKLSDVAARERRQMKVFGYNQPDEPKPFLRLACQAKAFGNATIVIPPWNGFSARRSTETWKRSTSSPQPRRQPSCARPSRKGCRPIIKSKNITYLASPLLGLASKSGVLRPNFRIDPPSVTV
jgi:ferredoxin